MKLTKAGEMGVRRVSIPSHATKSVARRQRQKERWFKNSKIACSVPWLTSG